MKVLVYVNKEKDNKINWLERATGYLKEKEIDYSVIDDEDLKSDVSGDAVLVLGGDGTILSLVAFCLKNSVPIIGINAGKMGFLTEFEQSETERAIDLLINGELKCDKRSTLKVVFKDDVYFGLNDLVVERFSKEGEDANVVKLKVAVENEIVDTIRGNGVIIATPTGSTAYSLSSGGSILAPRINAFSITPITAHSLTHRPFIYSSDSASVITMTGGKKAGVFIDGKWIGGIEKDENVLVYKASKNLVFLRKSDFNFYKRVADKFQTEV